MIGFNEHRVTENDTSRGPIASAPWPVSTLGGTVATPDAVDTGASVTAVDDDDPPPPPEHAAAMATSATSAARNGPVVALAEALRFVDVADGSLTPTSYLVLGLVGHTGSCTSYEMKAQVAASIGAFWSFPHSQLYAEPMRLVALGLLEEQSETTGRRRRTYRLTDTGRASLAAWLTDVTATGTEIRDLALLKLFFASQAEPAGVLALAQAQLVDHRARLAAYESMQSSTGAGADRHQLLTLSMGVRYERMSIDFWEHVASLPNDALTSDA
jgi:DNA-binding PadR family transcriptional regulator